MVYNYGVILTTELDLEVALNYGISVGSPPLLRFVTEHTEVEFPLCNKHLQILWLIRNMSNVFNEELDCPQTSLLRLAVLLDGWKYFWLGCHPTDTM